MVHGLEVIVAMNNKAPTIGEKHRTDPLAGLPKAVSINPALARAAVNRPWTEAELGGRQPNVYASYAKSSREPFNGRDGQREGLQQ